MKKYLNFLLLWAVAAFSHDEAIIQSDLYSTEEVSRDLSLLEERYRIETPIFRYDTLQFDLEYTVNDFMGDNFVSYQIYDGHLCREGNNDITGNSTYLSSRSRPDLKQVGDGGGNRTMKVTLNINPEEIASSPIFEDFETYAHVLFCVRFNVHNMDFFDPLALEVNFIETPVLLKINLVDGFEINLGRVSNTDLVVQLAYEDSAVEAYICDTDSNVVEGDAKNQGESVRVCVTPTLETLEQGAYLRYIDEFTFTREEHFQPAILPGTNGAPATELTIVSCEPGALICAFETLLGSEFFADGVGIVYGYGTAFLQFGQEDTAEPQASRRLQKDGLSADELLAARPTAFRFEIVSIPVENEFAKSGTLPLSAMSIGAWFSSMLIVIAILW